MRKLSMGLLSCLFVASCGNNLEDVEIAGIYRLTKMAAHMTCEDSPDDDLEFVDMVDNGEDEAGAGEASRRWLIKLENAYRAGRPILDVYLRRETDDRWYSEDFMFFEREDGKWVRKYADGITYGSDRICNPGLIRHEIELIDGVLRWHRTLHRGVDVEMETVEECHGTKEKYDEYIDRAECREQSVMLAEKVVE